MNKTLYILFIYLNGVNIWTHKHVYYWIELFPPNNDLEVMSKNSSSACPNIVQNQHPKSGNSLTWSGDHVENYTTQKIWNSVKMQTISGFLTQDNCCQVLFILFLILIPSKNENKTFLSLILLWWGKKVHV